MAESTSHRTFWRGFAFAILIALVVGEGAFIVLLREAGHQYKVAYGACEVSLHREREARYERAESRPSPAPAPPEN